MCHPPGNSYHCDSALYLCALHAELCDDMGLYPSFELNVHIRRKKSEVLKIIVNLFKKRGHAGQFC